MRLLIAGGGTGGHLYPALAVAQAFRAETPDGALLLVGRKGGPEEQLVPAAGFDLATVSIRGLEEPRPAWSHPGRPGRRSSHRRPLPPGRGARHGRLRDGAGRGRGPPSW